MTIFNPSNTTHTFKIIPRNYEDITMSSNHSIFLFDESLGRDISMSLVAKTGIENGYVSYSFNANMFDNRSYQLKITETDTGDIVFRGKAFCTNQSTQNYSING